MRSPRTSLLFSSFLFLTLTLAACGGSEGQGPEPTPTSFTLTVVKSGTGSGTVTMTGTGISCGTDCPGINLQGTSATLIATPDSGSTFAGWSGACSGTTTCSVTMDSDKAVTATFNQGSVPPPDDGPVPPPSEAISGTIQEWTGQTAVLKVEVYVGDQATVLQEVQITPDGAFSFTLPSADTIGQYLNSFTSYSCEEVSGGGVTATGPGVVATPNPLPLNPLYLNVYASSEGAPIGFLLNGGVFTEDVVTLVDRTYAGASGTVTGNCTLTGEDEDGASVNYTDTYDINLAAGWNELITEVAFTGDSPSAFTTSAGSAPAGSAWYYVPFDEQPPVEEDPPGGDPPVLPPGGDPPVPPPGGDPPAPGSAMERLQLIPHRLFR